MKKPQTNAELDAAVKDLIENTERWKRVSDERTRVECPWMTPKQIEDSWRIVKATLGVG